MSETPVKTLQRCIFCTNSSIKLFPFFGKKITDSKFIHDLISNNCNLKNDWQTSLKEKSAGICRTCFSKFENFFIFISNVQNNLNGLIQSDMLVSSKRLHSPISPVTPVDNIEPEKKTSFKRRKLIFPSPVSTSVTSDHAYTLCTNKQSTGTTLKKGKQSSLTERKEKILHKMKSIEKSKYLQDLVTELNLVSTDSVLSKNRSLCQLENPDIDMVTETLEEMSEKVPFLFGVLVTTVGKVTPQVLPTLAAVYGMLLFQKNHMFSSWQRCLSAICLRGQLEDSALTRMSHLGITLSTTSKLRLQNEAVTASRKLIVEMLKKNPLAKVTGDNLDVYVKRDIVTSTKRNTDLHMFASNIIFPRISTETMSDTKPDRPALSAENLQLTNQQRVHLLNTYKKIIAGIFAEKIEGFSWMANVAHVNHEFYNFMSQKSMCATLPIMDANEAKHEDCLRIMDHYENILTDLYTEAHGSDEKLKKFKVVLGGDQLTRSRLSEAKALRSLSPNYKKRFGDIGPIVFELWHAKQDLLEKFYKAFYSSSSTRTKGSLAFFKAKLLRTDVNGKVKGHFKSHMEFLKLIGEEVLIEQGKEFLRDIGEVEISPEDNLIEALNEVLDMFLMKYNYLPFLSDVVVKNTEKDEMFNYFNNIAQWFLHFECFNTTAKDGDIATVIPNLLVSLPLFYNHSCLSKYLVECIHYIIQVEHLLSPLMKLRVLEGSFVNVKGGPSSNVESDLVQEHAVRNQKVLIKQLGANKTIKAIERASGAGGAIAAINANIEKSLGIIPKSSRHVKSVSQDDKEVVKSVLQDLKPFEFTDGRKFEGFEKLGKTVFACIEGLKMKEDLEVILQRLLRGQIVDDDDIDGGSESESDDDLPDF